MIRFGPLDVREDREERDFVSAIDAWQITSTPRDGALVGAVRPMVQPGPERTVRLGGSLQF